MDSTLKISSNGSTNVGKPVSQTLHVHVAIEIQKVLSIDWSKLCCAL